MSLVQMIVVEYKLSAFASPVVSVEEDVDTAFAAFTDTERCRHLCILHHPLLQLLVPAPVAAVQLAGCQFLNNISRVLVKDEEKRFVGKGGHAGS